MKGKDEIKKRILFLRERITDYDYHYYVLDQPLTDDYQYDMLYKELKNLESDNPEFDSPDSPTKRVSEQNIKYFEKANHVPRMFSLDNTYSDEELAAFQKRIESSLNEKHSFAIEPKIDGTAVSIIYRNSDLFMALTRGDGETGDNVTSNVRTIRGLPLKLKTEMKGDITVRGEIFFTKKRFEELCEVYDFSNPRNAAAGTMKLLSAKEVDKRKLSIVIHTVITPLAQTHTESLKILSDLGLPVIDIISEAFSSNDIIDAKNSFEKRRFFLPYETDGIVIKLNQLAMRDAVGFTNKSPKWAFAFKYTPKRAVTKLESVSFQVGRTGVITPVANLSPVELSGTVVKRATLHNFEEIARLGLKINDYVEIEKSGEIIPKVLRTVTEKRTGMETEITEPETCPSCREKLVKYDDEVAVRCINKNCPEQIELSLIHFASKKAMNIDNMGPSIIEKLIENQLVRSISDIYSLSKSDLLSLDRIKEKSAQNLISSIESSKSRPLSKVIYGLGIKNIGEYAAEKLAERFKSMDAFKDASFDDLVQITSIGEESAKAILLFFDNAKNKEEIENLKRAGLKMGFTEKKGKLFGMSIAVTGTLKQFSREEVGDYISSHGGILQNDVTKNTGMLVAGENPGSKINKAQMMSVKIISEEELIKIAEER